MARKQTPLGVRLKKERETVDLEIGWRIEKRVVEIM